MCQVTNWKDLCRSQANDTALVHFSIFSSFLESRLFTRWRTLWIDVFVWAGVSCRQNQQDVVTIFFGKKLQLSILFIHSAWKDSQPESWLSINSLRTKTSFWQNGSISVERAWSHGMCTLTQTWWFKPHYVVCVCAHRRQLRVFINALLRLLRLQNLADHQVINERMTQNLGKKCGLDWPRKRRDCTDYNLAMERF